MTDGPGDFGLLSDRIAIRELTARFNRAVDGTDPDALLAVFTPDGELELLGGSDGRKVYAGIELAHLLPAQAGRRVHMTTDATIEIAGDDATQLCTLLLWTKGRVHTALFTGHYSDELIRTATGWRFHRRVAEVDFASGARVTRVDAPSRRDA